MKLKLHEFDLPLKYKFGISRETRTVQKTMIVQLEHDGIKGYGEAVANHKYYSFTRIDAMVNLVSSCENELADWDLSRENPGELWKRLAPKLSSNPFAQCAVDMAAYDLWGKFHKAPTYKLLGLNESPKPCTDYTIGIDDIDVMAKKLKEYADWPVFKIKLGTDRDMEIMKELRRETDAVLRVDANCAWTGEQTVEYSGILKELGVEFIEQPLPAEDWDGMKYAFLHSALPLIADESCLREGDVERCHGFFHGVNIKVVKCGGLTPARRMIEEARKLGMKVMVGCMTESTVGISGIAQLMPLLDYVDADGPVLLAEDIASGVSIDKGVVSYNSAVMGNGVILTGRI